LLVEVYPMKDASNGETKVYHLTDAGLLDSEPTKHVALIAKQGDAVRAQQLALKAGDVVVVTGGRCLRLLPPRDGGDRVLFLRPASGASCAPHLQQVTDPLVKKPLQNRGAPIFSSLWCH
jgi:hypothetical protein